MSRPIRMSRRNVSREAISEVNEASESTPDLDEEIEGALDDQEGSVSGVGGVGASATLATSNSIMFVAHQDQVRTRMDATGNMAVVAALMTSFAFSLLVTQPPEAAIDYPEIVDHFILSSSVATALSLIVLFQSAMEYQFCLRVLEAYGASAAFALIKSFRWQRRVGEVAFSLSIISFTYAAACWAILQSTTTGNYEVGYWSAGILGFGCLLVLCMLASMEVLKKQREKLEGGARMKRRNLKPPLQSPPTATTRRVPPSSLDLRAKDPPVAEAVGEEEIAPAQRSENTESAVVYI